MKKIYKAAVIGCGHIAKNFHIPAVSKNKNFKIVSAYDPVKKKLLVVKKKFQIKNIYTNFSKMLQTEKLDVAFIFSPPAKHADNILSCLKENLSVFVEKPFVKKLKEFKSIRQNVKSNTYIQCALHQRFRPISISIKKLIQKNVLGEIYFINIVHRSFRRIPKQSKSFSLKNSSGGGPLIDLGSHYFDLVCWLLNFPKIKTINCKLFKKVFKKDKSKYFPFKTFNNEEMAVGSINFKNKTLLNFELSYISNFKTDQIKIELFGSKGSYIWPEKNYYLSLGNKLKKKKLNFNNKLASDLQIKDYSLNLNSKKKLNRNLKQYEYIVELIDNLYAKSENN